MSKYGERHTTVPECAVGTCPNDATVLRLLRNKGAAWLCEDCAKELDDK